MRRSLVHAPITTLTLLTLLGGCRETSPAPTASAVATRSVTVYPVLLASKTSEDVATVVGMFLERGGVEDVRTASVPFVADPAMNFAERTAAFGAHVAKSGIATDGALYAEFLGTPGDGVDEVRGVMVDRTGAITWRESHRKGDAAFDENPPTCPMDCCVLLVKRLRSPLKMADPMRPDAPTGKLAARMEQKSGLPPRAEVDAMQGRLAKLRAANPRPSVTVYPSRLGTGWSGEAASRLAMLLEAQGSMRATAAEQPLPFSVEASANEQRVLWSGAQAVRSAMKTQKGSTNYALFTDFMMTPNGTTGAVHTYLVAPDGEWVIVDFQNDHHDDFARIKPDSIAKCCDLVAARLAGYMK